MLFALLPACRREVHDGGAGVQAQEASASSQASDAETPPVMSTRGGAAGGSCAPDAAVADRGFSVDSVRAHGADGRFQIYFISKKAVLWLSVDLGERPGASFDAARLRERQAAELVVGERARNVLPSGPALRPPDARDRHLATGGTVRVDRLGGHQLCVSARELKFDGRPPVDLATRTVRISVPPP